MARGLWLRLLVTVLLPIAVAAVVVNLCAHDPDPDDTKAAIRSAWGADKPECVEQEYIKQIRACPTNIALHHRRITAHFEIPRMRGRDEFRDDKTIVAEYTDMAASSNLFVSDLGRYCLGLVNASQNNYAGALAWYAVVSNRAMPHLGYSTGRAHMGMGDYHSAIPFLQHEIAVTGNVEYAYYYLARCYAKTRQYAALRVLAKAPEAAPHMPLKESKLIAILGGRIDLYLWMCVWNMVDDVTCIGLTAAVIILAGWLLFIRRLDVFEPERPKWLLAALGLGVLSAVFLADFGRRAPYGVVLHCRLRLCLCQPQWATVAASVAVEADAPTGGVFFHPCHRSSRRL